MELLDGATIEYESTNPLMAEFIGEVNPNKIDILNICEYLGINDNNFGDSETFNKVEKIIGILGENAVEKIQSIVSEVGFKPGVLDEIYAKVMLDKEIWRTTRNLDNLLKQKYGDTSNI
jgi:hypothetical protein